ncbi:Transcriptional regulatory protein SEF1 [Lachnellula suecica]|uniref:Transcriptional regulatory protein SEF1 n=1 Tax=Lachnellula suecica TaxID=602035 RepID=A0A8T9CBU0_9HELO|nr:Transcriptional regulatory protein SEF1 [Lachnellula suecica]
MSLVGDRLPKRNQGACTTCRQVKLKCDSNERFPAPCTRCSKKNLQCRTDPNFKRTRTRNRLDDVTNQLNAIQKTLAQQSHATPSVQHDSTPGPSPSAQSLLDIEESTFYRYTNLPDSSFILDHVSMDHEHVMQLFAHFEAYYYRHCPILDTSVSIAVLYQTSPILFWTIVILSSRWHPTLYYNYNNLLDSYRILLGRTLVEHIFYLESIQALTTLCFWPLSVRRQVEDPSWNYCGLITHAARKMGIDKVQTNSPDRTSKIKRKTWIAIVQANCTHAWTSGMTVPSEILNSLQSPPPGPCTAFENQFFTKTGIWRRFAECSLMVMSFRQDMDSSLSFVQSLCADLEHLRDGQEESWTLETDVIVAGAQLCIYALQLDQGRKRSETYEAQNSFYGQDKMTFRRNVINMAYMTAAKFIHRLAEMVSNGVTITCSGDQASIVPQRYLPKYFFGLLLLSMAFIFRTKMLHASDPKALPSKPELHITQVYQILTSWSREPLDEHGRAARVMRILLRADIEGQVNINEANPEGRPGVAFLDEVIKVAKDLRERGAIETDVPIDECTGESLHAPMTDFLTIGAPEVPQELIHDPSLEWTFPWGLDLFSSNPYNFDINNMYNGFTP